MCDDDHPSCLKRLQVIGVEYVPGLGAAAPRPVAALLWRPSHLERKWY
jgi:hypothetical protein